MGRSNRWLVAALVTALLLVLLLPETWVWASLAARRLSQRVVAYVSRPIPEPVLLGVGMIVLLVLSFLVIFGIVRLFTSVGTATGERVAGWYDRLTPDSPQTKALVFMVTFVVVFVVGAGVLAPWVATNLTESTGIDDVVSDIRDGRYTSNMADLYDDDAVTAGEPTVSTKGANDTDGDTLPDAWERAGETPGGAPLPDADPGQLDLYVQLTTGDNVSALSDDELARLEAVWAGMPVENPDGSTGIDIHVLDGGDRTGSLDYEIRIGGAEAVDRFYTEGQLGPRYCLYRGVTLGHVTDSDTVGYAEAPGYAVAYDGSRFDGYDGEVPYRVAMITHGLLHTVVGSVDGDVHTDEGWLAHPGESNEFLSEATASKLETSGFVTTERYRQRCGQVFDAAG